VQVDGLAEQLADETWIGGTPDGAYARIVLHSCRAVAISPRLALTSVRPGLARVALTEPPVRRIAAARLAASFRSPATTSMLGVLKETTEAFTTPGG
jgi:hypothetical protein